MSDKSDGGQYRCQACMWGRDVSESVSESRPDVRTNRELAFIIIIHVFRDGKKYLEVLKDVSNVYIPSIVAYLGFWALLYPYLIKIILKSVKELQ